MKQLLVSDLAVSDITEIIDYIAKDRPEAAERIFERFWQEFDFLSTFPSTGHRRKDVGDDRYRFRRIKSFIICYRIDDAYVKIVRVLHGARDFRAIEFE